MEVLIEARNLKKTYYFGNKIFNKKSQSLSPVNDVSFKIYKNQNLAIAGESGSGKTTLARLLGMLEVPDQGQIFYQNEELNSKSSAKFRLKVQYIFQELYDTLNPKRTVQQTLFEPLAVHKLHAASEGRELVLKNIKLVGLEEDSLIKYPYQLSGGQRQRVAIARALMLSPQLIIADEPVSALDVSIRAQILNLMNDLQKKLDITFLLISHDLSVLRFLCRQIIIYFAGEIVEYQQDAQAFYCGKALHPYSRKLLESSKFNAVAVDIAEEVRDQGLLNSAWLGCRYYSSCPLRSERCKLEAPKLRKLGEIMVACHNVADHK